MTESRSHITRREALVGAAALGAGFGADRLLGSADHVATPSSASTPDSPAVPFYGSHQSGIATPAQEYLYFAAFDVATDARAELIGALQRWTTAAASLSAGGPYLGDQQELGQPPAEPGEAVGLGPSRLTLTFGFGPSLFEADGRDRFALSRRRPDELRALPPLQGESLEASLSGGDLCVQACADNPQVAFHAVHLLARVASGVFVPRWSQLGFGRTSSTSRGQPTPRNLMGFKDGTENIRAEEASAMSDYVWVQDGDGPSWMTGGSYLVARRIKILFDVWDATTLEGQQRVVGRHKLSGAPLGGTAEYDALDLDTERNGELVIPSDAHVRLASPQVNAGQRILRRGYSYSEGVEAGSGEIDAGLFFIAFQRSPMRQFIPIQRRLAASDALNRHTLHTSSSVFACPPGVRPGEFLGQALFSS
jgi:deferrochelatase/peroxidase EfeB